MGDILETKNINKDDYIKDNNGNRNKVAISIKGVSKSFHGRNVLEDINLDIYKGEIFVIMGGSGSGKSTLLRIMTGAIKPDIGEVCFLGKNINKLNRVESEKLRQSFGMSFQSAALLDFLTVEENVSLPLKEHTRLSPKIISMIARMKLDLVGLLGFEEYLPNELSGGMRKRVGIARAIAMDPSVVFYDEPTAGLDPIVCAVIDALIVDLARRLNITSVVVTHNMESVFRIADRIAMIYNGRILEVGNRQQIRNSANEIVQQFINGRVEGPIKLQR